MGNLNLPFLYARLYRRPHKLSIERKLGSYKIGARSLYIFKAVRNVIENLLAF